ncbi:MAG: hypothetical protein FWC43_01560 [Planctomycetaceae bacterium]|nr:hypothetical protein [Planctomycetaceae bacterium]
MGKNSAICRLPTAVYSLPSAVCRLLSALFWATGLLIAFRWREFTTHSTNVLAFALLALFVVGTILLLNFLGTGRWKTHLAVGPGVFVTVFLILPSRHFTGTSVYLLLFLPAIAFLCRKSRNIQELPAVDLSEAETESDLEAQETSSTDWDENVQMRLLRRKESDETELLEAWVRADFLPGERAANVHVPFCPPFAAQRQEQPRWETCQFEGNEVEIHVSQVNSLGVRIDLKRPTQRKNQESVGVYFRLQRAGIRSSKPDV